MTICIVGICDVQDGFARKAIALADRMITAGDTEFEQEAFSKISKLTENCLAITAGSALAHTELFNITRTKFTGTPTPPVSQVVQEIKDNYVKLRTARAEERYFKPLGLTVADFLQNQRSLDSTLVLRLSHQLDEATYGGDGGLDILIAGVDTTGAHIHYVHDPGSSESFDAIGYCYIGSGERHAESSLISDGYSSVHPLKKALYLIYESKKRAEIAPGVGRIYTDGSIVTDSDIRNITAQEMGELEEVYMKREEFGKSIRESIEKLVQNLPF